MRLGIFGGSFDPIHHGHLVLAECCRAQARLDKVWFLPAALQPLKPAGPQASDEERCQMIELAIGDRDGLGLCRLEIERGGTSYTVDTLRALKETHLQDDLFLLLGADALADFPHWRDPAGIVKLATPLVVARQGAPKPDLTLLAKLVPGDRAKNLESLKIEMPVVPISSSEIRQRVGRGEPIDGLTPPQVIKYIDEHGLYRIT